MNWGEWIKTAWDSTWVKLLMLTAALITVGRFVPSARQWVSSLYQRIPQEFAIGVIAVLSIVLLWAALFRHLRRLESRQRLAKAMTVAEPRGACTALHVFARNDRVRLGAPDGARPFIYLSGEKPDEFYLKSQCYVDLFARPQSFNHFEVAVSIPPVTDAEREEAVAEFERAQDNLSRDFRVCYAYIIPRQAEFRRVREKEEKTTGDELKPVQDNRKRIEGEIKHAQTDKVRLFDERVNREGLQGDTAEEARAKASREARVSLHTSDEELLLDVVLTDSGSLYIPVFGAPLAEQQVLFFSGELDINRWTRVMLHCCDSRMVVQVLGHSPQGVPVSKTCPQEEGPKNDPLDIPWPQPLQARLEAVTWTTRPAAFFTKPVAW